MTLDVEATANVDKVIVDRETTATGKINFNIGGRTREYPLHIVFCIDKSGSMSSSTGGGGSSRAKIDVANQGLLKAAEQLAQRDTFGVVSFNGSSNVEVNPTNGNNVSKARSDIISIDAGGGTNIRSGLQSSRRMLDEMPSEEAVSWIVLISDGKGTVPNDRDLKRNYGDNGIVIQAAGVGSGYDRQQMLNISQKTQGELEDIKSSKQLEEFFGQEVQKARQVAARDAELTINPTDLVDINEVYYSLVEQTSIVDPVWRGDSCVIDLGDINQDNPPEVVFEMDILASEDDVSLSAGLIKAVISTHKNSAQDNIEVEVDLPAAELGKVDEKDEPDVITTTDPELVEKKVSTLSQEGKLDEARSYLEDNKDVLSQEKYREVKSMIDDNDVTGLGKL